MRSGGEQIGVSPLIFLAPLVVFLLALVVSCSSVESGPFNEKSASQGQDNDVSEPESATPKKKNVSPSEVSSPDVSVRNGEAPNPSLPIVDAPPRSSKNNESEENERPLPEPRVKSGDISVNAEPEEKGADGFNEELRNPPRHSIGLRMIDGEFFPETDEGPEETRTGAAPAETRTGAAPAEDAQVAESAPAESVPAENEAPIRTAPSAPAREDAKEPDSSAAVAAQSPEKAGERITSEGNSEERTEVESGRERRSLWAVPGDKVEIFFTGRGWVYDQSRSSAAGVDFRERYYEEDRTEFVFNVHELGSYQLTFFREDLSTGERKKKVVDLICAQKVKLEDSAELSRSTAAASETAGREDGGLGDNPDVAISRAVARENSVFLKENLRSILIGLGKVPDAQEGHPGVSPEKAVDAAGVLARGGHEREAERLLKIILGMPNIDAGVEEELYYRLGQLYEKPGPVRDESLAVKYYRKVVQSFPAGVYWNEAKERISYLERYYLEVR